MRITKLLALAAVAVVAAACNGVSPTSPNNAAVTSDDAAALVGATALSIPGPNSACLNITEVKLVLLPSPSGQDRSFTVEAIYLTRGANSRCRVAPDWSSRPQGRLLPTHRDSFIVKVTRTRPPTTVLVTAKAPNGVQGSIRLR
jgi:hypothetical protein